MRAALFGGTFDPIHMGHLFIASYLMQKKHLDQMILIPAGQPPHKTDKQITEASLRFEMVQQALISRSGFTISRYELNHQNCSFTEDTVRYYLQTDPWAHASLYLVIGSDSLLDLHHWKNPDRILQLIQTLVIERPGYEIKFAEKRFLEKVEVICLPPIPLSSTEIRKRVKTRKSIRFMVPEAVECYIKNKGLYR